MNPPLYSAEYFKQQEQAKAAIEATARRIINLMQAGDSYEIALTSAIISQYLSPAQWVEVIHRVEELRKPEEKPGFRVSPKSGLVEFGPIPRKLSFKRERDDMGGGFGRHDY